jgi:hypothetical protein
MRERLNGMPFAAVAPARRRSVLLAFSLTYQREEGGTMGNGGQGWATRTDTEVTWALVALVVGWLGHGVAA